MKPNKSWKKGRERRDKATICGHGGRCQTLRIGPGTNKTGRRDIRTLPQTRIEGILQDTPTKTAWTLRTATFIAINNDIGIELVTTAIAPTIMKEVAVQGATATIERTPAVEAAEAEVAAEADVEAAVEVGVLHEGLGG